MVDRLPESASDPPGRPISCIELTKACWRAIEGFQAHRSANQTDLLVAQCRQMLNRLANAVEIVDADVADPWPRRADVQRKRAELCAALGLPAKISSMPKVMTATPSTRLSIMRRTELSMRLDRSRWKSREFHIDAGLRWFRKPERFPEKRIGNFRDDQSEYSAASETSALAWVFG